MISVYITKGRLNILYCAKCRRPLQMTNYRGIYCPECKRSNLADADVESILRCEECDEPLRVTAHPNGFGSYCAHCKFYPSLQDTYFLNISAIRNRTR